MATLQKFKLLATQCGVAQSPTRSPRTSPLIQLRRRKNTLRMLLSRSSSRRSPTRREPPNQQRIIVRLAEKKSNKALLGQSHKLKDLFVSAPPFQEDGDELLVKETSGGKNDAFIPKLNGLGGGFEPGSSRPVWVGFRHRLLRRAWRPMLVTIPE